MHALHALLVLQDDLGGDRNGTTYQAYTLSRGTQSHLKFFEGREKREEDIRDQKSDRLRLRPRVRNT